MFVDQGMANVALGLLMLELTGSAGWVAVAVAARGLPLFFLTMPAGLLADRWDRRQLLVITQVVAAVSAVTFALLVASDRATAPLALIYAVILGSSTAVGLPTRQAMIPMLLPREDLLNAVVTGSMARTSSQLIGPAFAGLLIPLWGIEASFAVQAAFLVLSTLTLLPLSRAATQIPERADRPAFSVRGDLVEAWRFLRGNVPLLVVIGLMVNTGLFMIGPNQALIPVLVTEELEGGAQALGFMFTAMALGTLSTSLFLTSMGGMPNKGGFFAMALIGGSVCFAGIALSPAIWMAMVFFFPVGFVRGILRLDEPIAATDAHASRHHGACDVGERPRLAGHDAAGRAVRSANGGAGTRIHLRDDRNVSNSLHSPFPKAQVALDLNALLGFCHEVVRQRRSPCWCHVHHR